VGQGEERAATGSMDILAAYLRVPGRAAAAGDRTLPVPAGVAWGVLVFLGVVEVPDFAEAVIVETGAWHRLQINDENLGRSGADVDAVDEVDVVASPVDFHVLVYCSLHLYCNIHICFVHTPSILVKKVV